MATLTELIAAEQVYTIGGVEYRMPQLGIADYSAVEEAIRAQRGDPIATAKKLIEGMKRADPERRRIMEMAYDDATKRQRVTAEELSTYLDTIPGMILTFWLRIRKHKPEITLDRASVLFEQWWQKQTAVLRAQLQAAMPPGATEQDLLTAAAHDGSAQVSQMIQYGLGMPSLNPTMTPATDGPASRCRGSSGSARSQPSTDGPTPRSEVLRSLRLLVRSVKDLLLALVACLWPRRRPCNPDGNGTATRS